MHLLHLIRPAQRRCIIGIRFLLLWQRWWWLVLLLGAVIIWFSPLDGQVIITTNQRTGWAWPQIQVNPTAPQAGEPVTVWVTDLQPWSHVLLTVNGEPTRLVDSTSNQAQTWTWEWHFNAGEQPHHQLIFYRDCHTGCQRQAQTSIGPNLPLPQAELRPTKLGLVFPNPARNWQGRSGWGVELTYATLAEESTWGIDRLARQVQQNRESGVRMLVRVDYAPGQSLPPVDDEIALSQYLAYLQRLARDDRLTDIYGYIIGSSYNAIESNSLAPDHPTTPAWYARLFNGYAQAVDHRDNAVQVIRAENEQVRILVGPVQPWNTTQSGPKPNQIDAPWLNYMNTLVAFLDEATQAKQAADLSFAGPDGFAIQASGNVTATALGQVMLAEEPQRDLPHPDWPRAQAGFGVYQDWLAIINDYPTTQNRPVYISATNTFVPNEGAPPAQNYPIGWLTNALDVVNQTPQIVALIWFMDDLPGDDQWQWFSLGQPSGRLVDAAAEFESLLRGEISE